MAALCPLVMKRHAFVRTAVGMHEILESPDLTIQGTAVETRLDPHGIRWCVRTHSFSVPRSAERDTSGLVVALTVRDGLSLGWGRAVAAGSIVETNQSVGSASTSALAAFSFAERTGRAGRQVSPPASAQRSAARARAWPDPYS
ncbi:hypothetical protein GCM10020369_08850 [Cryptosporangium minutisporangium]|uniref:Uncharacterized protein n=1 Tax=Cryptosporangium minutisporangium TaxID=113569 RepID=A0ABP6SR07_9ACTN